VNTDTTDTIAAPKACPFCSSVEVTTTSKAVTSSTYWRCTACGQIWNAERLGDARPAPFGRFSERHRA
jgi:transposase-like protein